MRASWAALLTLTVAYAADDVSARGGSFVINGSSFLQDGVQTQLISGSMHYFRMHPSTFDDRMAKAKQCGLNAVQTYISWLRHEPSPGHYRNMEDLTGYLDAAQRAGLLVILRPGPYICAEYDFGGMPSWLLNNGSDYSMMRSMDPGFLASVDRWFSVLLPTLRPYLYSNGGPIVLAQVDNEAGYWGTGPSYAQYLGHIRDLYVQYWGEGAVIIHSTDGWNQTLLANSHTPAAASSTAPAGALGVSQVYQTVDFGYSSSPGTDLPTYFSAQYAANGYRGPLMNSEFYIGGSPGNRNWGDGPYTNDTQATVNTSIAFLTALLAYSNASMNMYMFHGGTNWGWEAGLHADGAPHWNVGAYCPGSALTEAGDPSPYYQPICSAIRAHRGLPAPVVPPVAPKADYGYGGEGGSTLSATGYATLWAALPLLTALAGAPQGGLQAYRPPSQESLSVYQQGGGYTLYRSNTTVAVHADASNVWMKTVRDRAYLFLNATTAGGGQRLGPPYQRSMTDAWTPPSPPSDSSGTVQSPACVHTPMDILVENMGRDCFGGWLGQDLKGLPDSVFLGTWTNPRHWGWSVYPLPLHNLTAAVLADVLQPFPASGPAYNASTTVPTAYTFSLLLDPGLYPVLYDTFLDMRGWGKGAVLVNGQVLGRYWNLGPEYSLYIPAALLQHGQNDITVFEAEGVGAGCASVHPDPAVRAAHVAAGEVFPGTLGMDVPEERRGLPAHARRHGRAQQSKIEAAVHDAAAPSALMGEGSHGSKDELAWYGGCPSPLPVHATTGAPTLTFRTVPVRNLPQDGQASRSAADRD